MILALGQGLTGGCRVVLNSGFVEIGWRGRWRGVEERVIGGSSSQSFHHRRPGNQRKPSEICAHQLLFNSVLSAQLENKFHCEILTYCLVSAAAELGMDHFFSLLIFPLLLLIPPFQCKPRAGGCWPGRGSQAPSYCPRYSAPTFSPG